jgi:hypothetical protein
MTDTTDTGWIKPGPRAPGRDSREYLLPSEMLAGCATPVDDIMRLVDRYAGEMGASEANYATDNDTVGLRRYKSAQTIRAQILAALRREGD